MKQFLKVFFLGIVLLYCVLQGNDWRNNNWESHWRGFRYKIGNTNKHNEEIAHIMNNPESILRYVNSIDPTDESKIDYLESICFYSNHIINVTGDLHPYLEQAATIAYQKLPIYGFNEIKNDLNNSLQASPWYLINVRYKLMKLAERLNKIPLCVKTDVKDLYQKSRKVFIQSAILVGSLAATIVGILGYVAYQKWFKKKNLNKLKQGQIEKK